MIKVYVSRFDNELDLNPHIECYEIEKTPGMKVLDALKAINKKYYADISYRESCRAGQCGSCAIKFNGIGALACQKEIENGALIEPLDFPIIKDLIVDKNEIEQKIKDIHLNLIPEQHNAYFDETITSEDIKDTKTVRGCIECHSCLSTCPVVKYFKDEYSGPYIMRYLSKFDKDPRDIDDRLKESLEEGLFNCTSCGRCYQVCPKNINTFGNAIAKFREKACNQGEGPLPEQIAFKENIQKTGRSVTGDRSFVEEISKSKSNKKPKVALFTGCMMDKKLPDVGHDLIEVLEANGIEVDVPEDQVCCGSPLINTGQTKDVQALVDKNKEVFKDYDTVITVCAGCGSTLKNKHPEYGSKLNVLDISEFLIDKLDYDKMNKLDMKVTWHDPCHLVRGQGISNPPREILKNMKGVEFIEMSQPDQCCGAGGGIKAGHPEIATKLASEKAKMIKDTDAEVVITICPFCQLNIQDGLDSENIDVKAMNLVQLLKKAYE